MYSHKGHDIIYSFNAQESYNMQHFMTKLVQKFKFGAWPSHPGIKLHLRREESSWGVFYF